MNPEVIESVNKVVNNPASKEQLKQLPEFINSTDVATAGLEQTVNGIYAISSNYGQVKKLNDGMQTMNKSLPTLAAGVKQLDDGSKQLNAGMKELTANSAKLNSGASQLSDGLNTLNGQIPALADGVNKLADGSTQVKDGNKELADKLGEASDKLTDVKLTNNTAKMIADPTKTKQEKYSDVPNYGHALAPYFMSVSLFVGCLVFNFVYPIRKIADRKNSNATQWFMSKLTIGFITSSMMALIIGTVMRMIGLEVAQPMNFYMTLLVTAWLFMFMIMFLAMSFDNPGRFIAVLLLVMQLGSSGGVFPMPLISKFYNVLNPFMPMTYSIYSLRQAISTGLGDEFYRNSMLILVILAIVFIILLGISMQILYRKGLAGYSQLHENQKLLDDDYTGKFAKEEDPYTLW
nr:YhgE/Pip family protein [Enterococcus cecorum]